MIVSELLSTKRFLAKDTRRSGQKKYLLLILSRKLILGRIELKTQTEKKTIGNFYEKEVLLSKL